MQHKDRLSDEERKARRKESSRRYREKNRDKCIAASLASRAKRHDHYREKDREYKSDPEYRERQRLYRQENREQLKNSTMAWREANQVRFALYQLRYREQHRESAIKRSREWRLKNQARSRESGKAWRRLNKRRLALKEQRRRARIRGVGGDLSPDIHAKLLRLQKGRCAVCRKALRQCVTHLDHIMPISKGGQNVDGNVQLLCMSCNCSKHAKHPVDFMQQRGFLC